MKPEKGPEGLFDKILVKLINMNEFLESAFEELAGLSRSLEVKASLGSSLIKNLAQSHSVEIA